MHDCSLNARGLAVVKIDGCSALHLQAIRNVVGARQLRVSAGLADRDAYLVDYEGRAEADLAVAALNGVRGIHAAVISSPQ